MDYNNFLFSFSLFLVLFSYNVNVAFELATIPFNDGFSHVFGNVLPSFDGNSVQIILNKYTGSGFNSSERYAHGFFSAKIKLPSNNYTAGVCVTFYTTNGQVFETTHDEIDFEFLGHIAGKPWEFQTNMYGNGSKQRGREERYGLWFDPTQEYHRYSILWTRQNIIFYIDEVPIREVLRSEEMGSDYPSKPMSLYSTIWDASGWATDDGNGGKCPVNYEYAPFVAEYKDLIVKGCSVDSIQQVSDEDSCSNDLEAQDYAVMTPSRRLEMRRFRRRYMHYSYCYDTNRYHVPLPECDIISEEKHMFNENGNLKVGESHRRKSRRRGRTSTLVGDM